MKKILSLLMLMLLCTTAWAETVTFVAGTDKGSTTDQNADQVVKDGITISSTSAGLAYDQYRFYKNSVTTISSTVGNITKVEFTMNGSYSATLFSGTGYDSTTATWTGDADELSVTASAQARVDQIVVTYTAASGDELAKPVITFDPTTAYQGDEVTCTITCATEGATIQYSTDGTNYQDYTQALTLTETTTVYAKATLGNDVSEVAEKTITFNPTVTTLAGLDEMYTTTGTAVAFNNGAAIVTFISGNNCYVKDDTGVALLFGYNGFGDAQVGKKITGFKGTAKLYNGLPEVTDVSDITVADDAAVTVTPTERTINDITTNPVLNEYTVLRGVSITTPSNTTSAQNFTITDTNGNTLTGRTNFYSTVDFPELVTEQTFDIEGFVGKYNTTTQFYPSKFTNVTPAAAVETPVITFDKENPTEGETVTCTITCATDGATIMYALGEGEYQTYTEPFTLTETTTVKAKAVLGEDESYEATETITFAIVLDGDIVFKDNDNDTSELSENDFMSQVEKGADLLDGATDLTKVYGGKAGLKLGTSSAAGSMTLNLANAWNATKISFIAKRYNADKAATITVNDNTFDLTADFARYEITLDPAQEIQAITFATNKYANLKVINIEGTEVTSETYDITLDNEPGDYTTLINVKPTVTPALPEGATLKYIIDDADPVVYDMDANKGVYLLKSSKLTFTAYDANDNVLATAGGDYNYIINVFGDLDNDGEVTVSDLNIIVNLCLSKFSN